AAAQVTEGRGVETAGETVAHVDAESEAISVGGLDLEVVGLADKVTWYFGTPTLFVPLEDAQAIAFRGQPLAMGVAVQGAPTAAPVGLLSLTNSEVIADLERPLQSSTETIALLNFLLWIVAAGIIGSMVYLSAMERSRDFAVFKAIGATNRSLLGGLIFQAFLLSIASAVVAAVIAQLLIPAFPFAVEIPLAVYARLGVIVLTVGLLASVAGLRRAVTVQPALAFGGP
ncbi:MAG TPA: ABC transporter permease, partial [Egibacteraceae bacterium]|nr:ABC transporter permease [Egibacteraceae bacterium]